MRDYGFPTLNQPVDPSADFAKLDNLLFVATRAVDFDPRKGTGAVEWRRNALKPCVSFNQIAAKLSEVSCEDFPPESDENPVLPFSISFVTPRTVRLRVSARPGQIRDEASPMLVGPVRANRSWKSSRKGASVTWRSRFGSVTVTRDPWHVEFRDAEGKLLTRTQHPADTMGQLNSEPTPFSFALRTSDRRRRIAASFALAPDEKLFGCGESFTRLNKRGQKLALWTTDAIGAQTREMYKPVPFFLSSRGYAMFVHGSTSMTFDFGATHDQALVLTLDDDALDLFVFLGGPKDVLSEYTALTGRSPLPPLWSFGLWMSRITYGSEKEVRGVAAKLRSHRIPADVIHIDVGWFDTDWRCDFRFSKRKFPNPRKMLADLRRRGFRVCLWQLPYFTPRNPLFAEIVRKGFAVLDADGKLPTDDAIIDFSSPKAVAWYQSLLARLLEMGVSTIKVDFGEAAPYSGAYASGRSGIHEHNLYPLRYNAAAAEIVRRITGDHIIWARSAWAGSQRFPVHWGGDAENSDSGLAATLRAGLSFGLCGFSFWSHDIGGFCKRTPEDVYRRWLPFGMLTSHSRCHGVPPKEPWHFSRRFVDEFRRATELKYRLMPYVYAQAADCSKRGFPMVRPLFFEFPDDPGSWLVEDEYLFGRDLLVAPMMEEVDARKVYLPPGKWIDYQSGEVYEGARWHEIEAGEIPVVLLVRDGAVIPHAEVAQNTAAMDWRRLELVVFSRESDVAEGLICLPDDGVLRSLKLKRSGGTFVLAGDPLKGRVRWKVSVR